MSAYDNDPRVRTLIEGQYRVAANDLYLVTAWGEGRDERWNVTLSADAREFDIDEACFETPRLFGTADEAIRSLIGDPR